MVLRRTFGVVYTLYMQSETSVMPKSGKKDSSLIIRIPKEDRDEFVRLCDEMDTSASRELRSFIQSFLKKNGAKKEKKS